MAGRAGSAYGEPPMSQCGPAFPRSFVRPIDVQSQALDREPRLNLLGGDLPAGFEEGRADDSEVNVGACGGRRGGRVEGGTLVAPDAVEALTARQPLLVRLDASAPHGVVEW